MGKKKRMLNNESAQRLSDWLSEIDMNQTELADLIGYTQQYISNIINGKRPMTLDFAQLVSEKTAQGKSMKYDIDLKIRPQYLLCMDDIKTTEDFYSVNFQRLDSVNNACYTLLTNSLKEVCLREGIEVPHLDSIGELFFLQAQLQDYADSLMWNYVAHRKHSHVWSYLDGISELNAISEKHSDLKKS